jgi:hypothetical protein
MEVFNSKDEILVRYLLNEQSKNENEELEDEMILDPELSDRAQVIEMNLIESYVLNEMDAVEKARFEKGFLLFPENRDKVEDARAFHESLRLRRQERLEVPPQAREKTPKGWFASLFQMPVPAMAFAALVLFIAVVAGFLIIRRNEFHEAASNNGSNNISPQVVSHPENSNNDNSTQGKSENTEEASTNNSANRNSPPNQEIAKLNPNPRGAVVITITGINGRVGANSRGAGKDVKAQLIKIPMNDKFFTLKVNLESTLKSDEYFKNNLNCSVDISNSKSQPLFPKANYLPVKAKLTGGEFPYQVSINVPTGYLKEGELYYFRVSEIDSLTPFKVKFIN